MHEHDSHPWTRPRYRTGLPPAFRCPECACTRLYGAGWVERSVAERCGATLYCWDCEHAEQDDDGTMLARWRNPARPSAAELETRYELARAKRRERATADKRPFQRTWPWQPRVRTSAAYRRRHALPACVEAVVACPDDLYLRLVAADVIERDDPARAAFVRAQVALEAELTRTRASAEVIALIDALEPVEVSAWSPELAVLARERIIADRGFARGFVEHVTMSCADFLAHGDEVFERAPIRMLTLTGWAQSAQLGASPYLARIEVLRLRHDAEALEVVSRLPLPALRALAVDMEIAKPAAHVAKALGATVLLSNGRDHSWWYDARGLLASGVVPKERELPPYDGYAAYS